MARNSLQAQEETYVLKNVTSLFYFCSVHFLEGLSLISGYSYTFSKLPHTLKATGQKIEWMEMNYIGSAAQKPQACVLREYYQVSSDEALLFRENQF